LTGKVADSLNNLPISKVKAADLTQAVYYQLVVGRFFVPVGRFIFCTLLHPTGSKGIEGPGRMHKYTVFI
jgi:hypothetical protein